ncbi:MAG TPA: PEP-CTERM sorting domain-containing protein [Terriglobales bacterium]|nr:PEP-CTERM sorting domain-containing protein [Terriglobales bacterium]
MKLFRHLGYALLPLLVVVGTSLSSARADSIVTLDIGNGPPSVHAYASTCLPSQLIQNPIPCPETSGPGLNIVQTSGEFVHFTLIEVNNPFTGNHCVNLFDSHGLSDKLVVLVGVNSLDAYFGSGPDVTNPLFPNVSCDTSSNVTEIEGTLQTDLLDVHAYGNPNTDGDYHFAIKSDEPGPPPIPEPASLALLGTGIAAVGFTARRKLHRKQ